jgi:hypothetical protein
VGPDGGAVGGVRQPRGTFGLSLISFVGSGQQKIVSL